MSGLCAEPTAGAPAVCTQACTVTSSGSTCLLGFACTEGYCFADPLAGGVSPTGTGGSSGGCAVSTEDSSGWSTLGWLSFGLIAVASRRKRARVS